MMPVENNKRKRTDEEEVEHLRKIPHLDLENISCNESFEEDSDLIWKSDVLIIANLEMEEKVEQIEEWASESTSELEKMVESLHHLITLQLPLATSIEENEVLKCTIETIGLLYAANIFYKENDYECADCTSDEHPIFKHLKGLDIHKIDPTNPKIPFSKFVHEQLSNSVDAEEEYDKWLDLQKAKKEEFSIVTYRFLLMSYKKVQFYSLVINSRINDYLSINGSPSELIIDRNKLIESSLLQFQILKSLGLSAPNLKISVKFEGEIGQDNGGVTKEYLQLLFKELVEDLKQGGTLIPLENNMCYWFNTLEYKDLYKLELLGIVMGMSLYNNVTLNLSLPIYFYKKLCAQTWKLKYLETFCPSIYQIIDYILNYEGDDIGEMTGYNFAVSHHTNRQTDTLYELKEGGTKIILTQENKHEFAYLYAHFIMEKGVYKQLIAFFEGFYQSSCMDKLQEWLFPDDIRNIFSEQKELNMVELQNSVSYDGYDTDSQCIQHFWEIVYNFTDEQKKSLFQFVTGSENVPIGGVSSLKIIIQRNGDDSDMLPSSSTCFNILRFPEYSNRDKLKQKLLISINNKNRFYLA